MSATVPRPRAIVLDTLACVVEPEAEFLMLLDLRERTTRRLAELAAFLAPDPAAPILPDILPTHGDRNA